MQEKLLTLSNEAYHADTSRVSKSGLDKLAKSAAHYHAKYLAADRKPEEQTDALILGSAVHAALLEPHLFATEYGVMPKMERRSNAGKEAYAAFMAANAGKTWLDAEDFDRVQRMRDAVLNHEAAGRLLAQPGHAEKTVHFTHPESGIDCKLRMDFRHDTGRVVLDIKTTEDASPEAFAKSVANYRYHVQQAFYTDGLIHAGLTPPEYFVFVAVEKKHPYLVATYVLPTEAVEVARELYHRDLFTLVNARESGKYEGYPAGIQTLELPAWAMRRF